jgi:hypothetical protein
LKSDYRFSTPPGPSPCHWCRDKDPGIEMRIARGQPNKNFYA